MSFHQGCDVTVAGAGEQIALPSTGNSTIFNFCRSLPNRDDIDDLAVGLSASPSVLRIEGSAARTAGAEPTLSSALLGPG